MNEMYWLTRLDQINGLFLFLAIFATISAISSTVVFFIKKQDWEDDAYESDKRWMDFWSGILKKSVIVCIIAFSGLIFVPTTKEALMIYGIGGTIDYLKTDTDLATQIPHKAIEALDAWVESLNEDKTK